ncbi:MAG: hypothetical protein ABSB09_05045 [Acidimicrobiales bacterium]|jgi:uncharacterized BrkB/YihY/UPF0761 family membrane protein
MDSQPENYASTLPGLSALDDLPAKGADAVDAVVDFIQNNAVRPLTLATRAIVFGVIVLTASIVTVTLLSISFVRLLTVYIPGNRVWVSDLIVGAFFVVAGFIAWSQRIKRGAAASAG